MGAAADSRYVMGETFHNDPGKLSMTMRRPRGTIVAISPWNFPLILSMYKVAYGLATGNTVVLKPASETPVLGLKIGELFERAGLPRGFSMSSRDRAACSAMHSSTMTDARLSR